MSEEPKIRIGRIFGMGKYGYQLAEEILLQFQVNLEDDLKSNGYEAAAEYLIDQRGACITDPTSDRSRACMQAPVVSE